LKTFPASVLPQETDKMVSRSYRYLVKGNYKGKHSVEEKILFAEAVPTW